MWSLFDSIASGSRAKHESRSRAMIRGGLPLPKVHLVARLPGAELGIALRHAILKAIIGRYKWDNNGFRDPRCLEVSNGKELAIEWITRLRPTKGVLFDTTLFD